jgi:recombinational DNA repair protein RecR
MLASYARPLTRLLEALERLPGIGPRSAERLAV